MSTDSPRYRLFERFGVELEYMIVDRETLDVLPIADRLLPEDGERGFDDDPLLRGVSWSNELSAHVLELKVNPPVHSLDGLADLFSRHIAQLNAELAPHGAGLLPTAMHPWMDPCRDARLWPHEFGPIYESFHRIFDCTGHGWVNVQSTHVNLPFSGDDEFARLHAAIRLVLPILPALAASSPIVNGTCSGHMDSRLYYYQSNCRRLPRVTARVIPEPVFSESEYQDCILQPMYREIMPLDPDGVLQHEWLNARGAIARFDRDTIEIRLLDVQEHPAADLGMIALVVGVLRALVDERWSTHASQRTWAVDPLHDILQQTIREADQAVIRDCEYLSMLGITSPTPVEAGAVWNHLSETLEIPNPRRQSGCLARVLAAELGPAPGRAELSARYRQLAQVMQSGA